ncbi:MAG: hypothetical protein WCK34_11510 [Bacteroidota bacterium]
MKKYKLPTDDYFRETLKNHRMQPSDEARNSFLKDAMQIPAPVKTRRKGIILLSVLTAVVGLGLLTWLTMKDRTGVSTTGKHETPVNTVTAPINPAMATVTASSPAEQEKKINSLQGVNPEPSPVSNAIALKSAEKATETRKVSTAIAPAPISQNSSANALPLPAKDSHPVQNQPLPDTAPTTGSSSLFQAPPATSRPPTVTVPPVRAEKAEGVVPPATAAAEKTPLVSPGKKQDTLVNADRPDKNPGGNGEKPTRKQGKIISSVGIYYSPEWMFNTLEGTKFINNAGIAGVFQFGRFSIRTGAGISITKGTNELSVAYNDFLGTYEKLDSIEFKWSNPDQTYIPTKYMSRQQVWDSLMKIESLKVVKRHTYLQVPMIMGYDFWQSERLSVGFRAGPVMSVLLSSKQLSAAFDPGTKRIISINDIAPEQVSLNWQAMAGLNTSFRLTKELRIEVEPWIMYYFNTVFEQPDPAWKPWSAGIRAALMVKL